MVPRCIRPFVPSLSLILFIDSSLRTHYNQSQLQMQFAWRLPVPLKCEWREKDAVRFYPISIPQRIRGRNRVPPVYFRLLLGYTARLWALSLIHIFQMHKGIRPGWQLACPNQNCFLKIKSRCFLPPLGFAHSRRPKSAPRHCRPFGEVPDGYRCV